jgi:hypothetical protein
MAVALAHGDMGDDVTGLVERAKAVAAHIRVEAAVRAEA